MNTVMPSALLEQLGDQVQENISLAPYTSARIGGPADYLVTVRSAAELASVAQACWQAGMPWLLLGAGSNLLVSDRGFHGVAILNKAKGVEFHDGPEPFVRAESGTLFSNLAHRCASRGLSGLEWAATIPGTVGGAVYGNAGAFGDDTAGCLLRAELLSAAGIAWLSPAELEYGYRSSRLKRDRSQTLVLTAEFRLKNGDAASIQATIVQFTARRKASQPPGASMGSMFKNPAGDYAGRLIEAAGLKGQRIGSAEISSLHANFFVNNGQTSATDVKALIDLAQRTVKEKFNVNLELEVELVGEWE